jgi:hypothetical protein
MLGPRQQIPIGPWSAAPTVAPIRGHFCLHAHRCGAFGYIIRIDSNDSISNTLAQTSRRILISRDSIDVLYT